jgi:hypothetical protein
LAKIKLAYLTGGDCRFWQSRVIRPKDMEGWAPGTVALLILFVAGTLEAMILDDIFVDVLEFCE